jgi:hypothetical protein
MPNHLEEDNLFLDRIVFSDEATVYLLKVKQSRYTPWRRLRGEEI